MSKSCWRSCRNRRSFDQCSSVDRVPRLAETKACHRSMLVLERNAVLEAQIDQREFVHGHSSNRLNGKIMMIFASVEAFAHFFAFLVTPCCYRVRKTRSKKHAPWISVLATVELYRKRVMVQKHRTKMCRNDAFFMEH